MAFDQTNFDPTGSGSKGAPKIATYQSSDGVAAIEADGYFDSMSTILNTGDVIYVDSTGAATADVPKFHRVIVTTGDVAIGTSVAFA